MTALPDPLDDALDDLRITGSIVLHESYAPPWAIGVPDETRLRAVLGVRADTRVLVFHFVRRGGFTLCMAGLDAVDVGESDVVICPGGAAHEMHGGGAAPVRSLETILRRDGPAPAATGTPGATECVCGVFLVRAAPLNPLLGTLPPVVKVATGDSAASPTLAGVAALLGRELDRPTPAGYTASRLLEILCAETIRAFQRSEGSALPGWFRALADPRIATAIRHIHGEPAREWSVAALAERVALSPSRFAALFRETAGVSVMTYVARWRANVACRLLLETDLRLGQIALEAGYESVPAFSRAFKQHAGLPPAAWRAARRSSR